MLYVINQNYGGFSVPSEIVQQLKLESCWDDDESVRTSPTLIQWVKAHPEDDLGVVEIPESATDWELNEYDGLESVIAVVDGKIRHLRHI